MLNCPLIEAERLDDRSFDHTPESNEIDKSPIDISSEFPWLGAAESGNDLFEFTKNLGGNNGISTFTHRKQ